MTLVFPYTYGDDLSSAVANERVKKFALLSLFIAVPYFMSGSTAIAKDVPNQAGNHTSSSITTTAGKVGSNKGVQGALAGAVCAEAIKKGNLPLGILCGILAVIAIG